MRSALLRTLSAGALVSDDAALLELLHFLRRHDYRHTAVTPRTHAAVQSRPFARSPSLVDIFGWNRPFVRGDLDPLLYSLLERANAIETHESGRLLSGVRVASLDDNLFIHSHFPTDQVDDVFFGPDTYRFVRFIDQHIADVTDAKLIVDMGAGSGAGAIATACRLKNPKILLIDVNAKALRYAKINAAAAGLTVEAAQSDRVPGNFDLLIGNAPYLMDERGRSYRDGGDLLGGAVSLDWVRQSLAKLRPARVILLYTAAAYVGGRAPLLIAIEEECRAARASLVVDEIDPDVFGEQLFEPGYEEVERLAAVGIKIATKRDG